jgi:hypothetical protein
MEFKRALICTCGCKDFNLFEVEFKNKIKHVLAMCGACELKFRYLPQHEPLETPKDIGETVVPFGKHNGKRLKEIERDYVQWLSSQDSKYGKLARAYLEPSEPA